MKLITVAELRDLMDDEKGSNDADQLILFEIKIEAVEDTTDDPAPEPEEDPITVEEIDEMTKKELVVLIDEEDLDIDAASHKKVSGLRQAVCNALKLKPEKVEDDDDDDDDDDDVAIIEKGDTVVFTDDDGEETEGEVTKVNDKKKTVTLKLSDGTKVVVPADEVEIIIDD